MPDTLEDPRNAISPGEESGRIVDDGASVYMRDEEGDPDLSKMESGDGSTGGTDDDYGFYSNNSGQEPLSNIKSKFKGLGAKKKWAAFVFTVPSFVVIVGVVFSLFLLLSGFQVGHVARVLKDFNYIFATRGSRNFAKRGLLSSLNPNSKYKITNEKSLSKLGLINETNPEKSILKFDGKSSLVARRPEKISIGNTTIDVPQGFARNTPFRGAERKSFIKAVDDAILNTPETSRLSSYARNRAAKATFQSVGIKLRSWDKSKRFFQDVRDWKKTVREFYENSQEKIGRTKARISLSTNDAKNAVAKTEEALSDPDILSDPSGSPGQEAASRGVREVLEESETALAKTAKVASKISVVEIVGWLCLFRDLKKVIIDGSLQRMYGLARLSGQAFTAFDQFKSGDTSFAALGLTAKSYGNFATNVSYQQAMFGNTGSSSYSTKSLVDAGYDPIPEDFNIYQPLSVAKRLIVALGSIGVSKAGFNAMLPGLSSLLNIAGIDVDKQLESIDDGLCNALTTPAGIIGAVVVEIVIQIVIGVLSAGIATAGAEAGEQGAKVALVAAAKEVGSAFIGKLIFKQFRKELIEQGAVRAVRGTLWTFTKQIPKFLAITAGSVEAAALLEKLASSGSGADIGGVGPDFNFFNKASLGANFLGNSYSQTSNYGRPSNPDETAEVRETQYQEVLLANKSKSFTERLLSVNNPRSSISTMLGSIYLDRSSFNKIPQYVFNLPNLVFNPAYNNGLYSSILNTVKYPDSSSALAKETSDSDDGYHVWFYSKDEEKKLVEDPSFDPDANAEYVEANLEPFEEKYGKCYKEDEAKMFTDDIQKAISASQNLTNIVLNNGDVSGFAYCARVLKEDDALHYRVYKADNNFKQYMDDVAAAGEESTSTTATQSSSFSGDKAQDTSAMQCPQGTSDLGTQQIKRSDKSFGIRLCKVPSLSGGRGVDDVNASIAGNVLKLVNDAHAAGIELSGGGFRTNAEQIELRKSHCGGSNYAIYQAPPSSCNPPTARPGTSNHELGLAIDFNSGSGTISKGSAQFNWLQNNASKYGLFNLASEPWHWSVDGK